MKFGPSRLKIIENSLYKKKVDTSNISCMLKKIKNKTYLPNLKFRVFNAKKEL
jgi:hypothetical protein